MRVTIRHGEGALVQEQRMEVCFWTCTMPSVPDEERLLGCVDAVWFEQPQRTASGAEYAWL
jgi:hypothetical protein